MVERVEILRDGASAIYGSDAIAGVVNIITRQDIDGVTATVQLEDSTYAGGETERYSVAGGASGDNGNVTFSIEHLRRSAIFDRDIPEFANAVAPGLDAIDLVPFKALLAQLDAVMMAHVCYPEVDVAPAGYSAHWIQTVLRAQCDWSGVVLSDDLGMHAAAYAGKLRDRLFRSLEAGCDAVLVCQPEEVDALLQSCANDRLPPAPALLKLHGRNRVSREELLTVSEWRHWQQSIKDLEHCQWA